MRSARFSSAVLLALCCACEQSPRTADPTAPTDSAARTIFLQTPDSAVRLGAFGWLNDTLRVIATDRTGMPASDVEVNWTLANSDGQIRLLVTRTLADGSARAVWWLAATTDTQRVTVTVGNAALTFRALVAPAPVVFTPPVASLWVGDRLPLRAVALDRNGYELRHRLEWISENPGVAPVADDGILSALGVGEATIRIMGLDGSMKVTVTPRGTTSTVAGRVVVVDPREPFPRVVLHYRDSRGVGVGQSAPDGSFRVELKHRIDPRDTSEVTIEATGSDAPRYHPSIVVVSSAVIDSGLTVILLPTSWQIRRGAFGGEIVPISVSQALTPSGASSAGRVAFWFATHSDAGRTFMLSRGLWPDSAFPISVALVPPAGAPRFTAADSVGLWRQLEMLEDIVGTNLFEPRAPDPSWSVDSRPDRTVVVSRSGSPAAGLKGDQTTYETWTQTLRGQPAGPQRFVVHTFTARSAAVNLSFDSTQATSPVPVDHEFMHALGIGHGCNWPSATHTCANVFEGGGTRTARMSKWDVAYYELMRAVHVRERELGTLLSMIPALIGERVITLKKSPLPEN